jgi:hypothetical protein
MSIFLHSAFVDRFLKYTTNRISHIICVQISTEAFILTSFCVKLLTMKVFNQEPWLTFLSPSRQWSGQYCTMPYHNLYDLYSVDQSGQVNIYVVRKNKWKHFENKYINKFKLTTIQMRWRKMGKHRHGIAFRTQNRCRGCKCPLPEGAWSLHMAQFFEQDTTTSSHILSKSQFTITLQFIVWCYIMSEARTILLN